ncbi:MAG: crotonase/enoyl-CoA hydratase family protein [Rhodobacteraceae bacterium]|nr:crotonase/enoyl-CoA hydratase family protein [Paracoccaceae bacterium]
MNEILEIAVSEGIAEVRLNRPHKRNALSLEMFEALAAAGERLKSEAGLRAVVLCGAGGDFCSGLDMEVMQSLAGRLEEMRALLLNPPEGEAANFFQKPCYVWQELPVPVIAAVEGVCLGGGMQLALAADIRLCSPAARLSVMEAKWGLVPDMGISQSLPKLVPADRAKELMMTTRMVSGKEAASLGLVTRLEDDPLGAARTLAAEIAGRSPEAVNGIKRLVDQSWTMAPGEALRLEAEIQAPVIGGANQIEAVMANLQKRAPRFK